MRIFALETNREKIKEQFCSKDEEVVLMTFYHALSFLFAIIREIIITLVCFLIGIVAWFLGWPMLWVLGILVAVWTILVVFNVIKAYLDWMYDFILVTTDKVILVDQTSFWKREIQPIHIENIGSVSTQTQFWNIFHFGMLHIHLKEGLGGNTVTRRYVPDAAAVAASIADVVTRYQRKVSA
ncbi:MAG: hypothetical protein WCX61_05520 [Candidatus Peribacteraceae bacterium]